MNKLLVSAIVCAFLGTLGVYATAQRQKPQKAPGIFGLFLKTKQRSPEDQAVAEAASNKSQVRFRRIAKVKGV